MPGTSSQAKRLLPLPKVFDALAIRIFRESTRSSEWVTQRHRVAQHRRCGRTQRQAGTQSPSASARCTVSCVPVLQYLSASKERGVPPSGTEGSGGVSNRGGGETRRCVEGTKGMRVSPSKPVGGGRAREAAVGEAITNKTRGKGRCTVICFLSLQATGAAGEGRTSSINFAA